MILNKQPDANAQDEVHITHLFDAPRALVFAAWTDPEQLKNWFAPNGCTLIFKEIDIREGGHFHSCVSHPEFGGCWCLGTYLEITAPEKIVFTMASADEHGNAISPQEAGMAPDWPATTHVTVTFKDLNGKTQLTLHQTVATALAKATGAYPSWIQMFDRLNAML